MRNYYTDNGAGLDAKKNLPAVEKKPVENPARFKVPVDPVEKAEKQVVETKTEEEKSVEDHNTEEVKPAEIPEVFVTGMSVTIDEETAVNTSENTNAGGIVGFADASDTNIENCSNTGSNTNNSNKNKKNKHKK